MKLKVEIALEGADIEENAGQAAKRILEDAAALVGRYSTKATLAVSLRGRRLYDVNGNAIGTIKVTRS